MELKSFLLKATGSKFKKCPSTGENFCIHRELSTIDLELHGCVTPLFFSPKLHGFVAKSIKLHEKDPFKGRLHGFRAHFESSQS